MEATQNQVTTNGEHGGNVCSGGSTEAIDNGGTEGNNSSVDGTSDIAI